MGDYVQLTYWQVALATSLVLINGLISVVLRLRLEKSLAIASLRTVIQLLLIGLILEWIFEIEHWYVVLMLAAIMTVIAGVTAANRNQLRYPGIRFHAILSVGASAWLVTGLGLLIVLQDAEKWYHPQYSIPLLGMVLGNALNGIALGLNAFTSALLWRRNEVDTMLALGATRWEAARGLVQSALHAGMTPVINSMLVVGIVSLPGMMTGQLLAGTLPLDAVKYQIVIMFLITAATGLGTLGTILLSYRSLFTAEHQLAYRMLVQRDAES